MKRILLIGSILFLAITSWASPADTVRYSLRSPYHTVVTHLINLQPDNYHPAVSAKVFNPAHVTEQKAINLAIQLKQIFDGAGIFVDVDLIPNTSNFTDTTIHRHKYVVTDRYPEIYLIKDGDKWYYSQKTIASIPEIHHSVYPFGTEHLLKLLPKMGRGEYLGLKVWQIIGVLCIILLSFLIHKLLTLMFEKVLIVILNRLGYKDIANKLIKPVATPISLLVVFLFIMVMLPVLQLPIQTAKYVVMGLRAALPLFATLVFYQMVNVFSSYLEKIAEQTENTLDDQLVPLVRKALKTFVVIIGALFILNNLNFDVTALIAGVSIGGLAFALAAQDTIKNFFGSLMIFVDKPFQIGDWITSDGMIDGTVEEVGFRSTRIRTFRNSVISVPNGTIANAVVDNHGLRKYRRFYMKIAMTYDTPPHLIQVFVDGLTEIVKRHPKTWKENFHIYFNEMADFSLNVMFYIFFDVPTWKEELIARHEVLLEIVKLADKLGVNFAFPTQTLHMETFPEKKPLSPEYRENSAELRKDLEDFLKASEVNGGQGKSS
jgi:MscS family membrane protein